MQVCSANKQCHKYATAESKNKRRQQKINQEKFLKISLHEVLEFRVCETDKRNFPNV